MGSFALVEKVGPSGGPVGRRDASNRAEQGRPGVRTTHLVRSGPPAGRIVVDVGRSGEARSTHWTRQPTTSTNLHGRLYSNPGYPEASTSRSADPHPARHPESAVRHSASAIHRLPTNVQEVE